MRAFKIEVKKLLKYPLMWILLTVFVGFDLFIIYDEVGNKDFRYNVKEMYEIILANGVEISAISDSDNELEAYYVDYVNKYSQSYDSLDMQNIKQMKEDFGSFYPHGCYKVFLDDNYAKLQKRVEEIKSSGDDAVAFYPGDRFGIHGKLYSVIKICIIEMLIMICFSVLYLMDFERIHQTEDLVFSCKCGRKIMLTKMFTGLLIGFGYSVIILTASLLIFFAYVPMKGLWNTPVSSFMIMESSGLWEYPFITYVRLMFGQLLALSIVMAFLLTLLIGLLAGSLQFFINNSYITMVDLSAGFLGLFALPFAVKKANWIKTIAAVNPATLWSQCRRWFIENDISLSFAWSEYWTLGIWIIICMVCMLAGWRYFCRKDF